MPDINHKLNRFRQLVLEDAQQERDGILSRVEAQRRARVETAAAEIRRRVDAETQQKSEAITAETGREISRRMMADKRIIATRREEIGHEVFDAVREKLLAFTKTEDYLPHLKQLYIEAFAALGNPYDGLIWLRPEDMQYQRELAGPIRAMIRPLEIWTDTLPSCLVWILRTTEEARQCQITTFTGSTAPLSP